MVCSDGGWWIYLLRCADDSLYCGIARDVQSRLATHQSGRGARYTRSRLPLTLLWQEASPDRGAALRREAAIKKLSRQAKLALIATASEQTIKQASEVLPQAQ